MPDPAPGAPSTTATKPDITNLLAALNARFPPSVETTPGLDPYTEEPITIIWLFGPLSIDDLHEADFLVDQHLWWAPDSVMVMLAGERQTVPPEDSDAR